MDSRTGRVVAPSSGAGKTSFAVGDVSRRYRAWGFELFLPLTQIRTCLSTDHVKAEDGCSKDGLGDMHYTVLIGYEADWPL